MFSDKQKLNAETLSKECLRLVANSRLVVEMIFKISIEFSIAPLLRQPGDFGQTRTTTKLDPHVLRSYQGSTSSASHSIQVLRYKQKEPVAVAQSNGGVSSSIFHHAKARRL